MVSKSKQAALGGVLAALCLFSLYFAVYFPTNRLFLYGLSSVFSAVILIETDVKWAWVFYGATSLLGFFIIPNKIGVVPYILFFGLYGIIKYYIESIRNMFFEIILKGGYFLFSMLFTAVAVKELFAGDVHSKIPVWGLAAMGLIVFYIYDYVYTQFVIYYEKKLRKRI